MPGPWDTNLQPFGGRETFQLLAHRALETPGRERVDAEFRAQHFDFTWTGHEPIDSCFHAQPGKAQDLVVYCVRNSNLAQRLFGCAC